MTTETGWNHAEGGWLLAVSVLLIGGAVAPIRRRGA
jgi:hypothetical protein